jgi:hypothetical protein
MAEHLGLNPNSFRPKVISKLCSVVSVTLDQTLFSSNPGNHGSVGVCY